METILTWGKFLIEEEALGLQQLAAILERLDEARRGMQDLTVRVVST
jgi:hypothetical protein